jgi:SAM-dependent methyltransferase
MKYRLSLNTARFLYRIAHRVAGIFIDIDNYDTTPDARLYEYTFVIERLSHKPKGKVLDVGCTSRDNFLAPALAAIGWEVYGIDSRLFRLEYPGFHFVSGDITHTIFPDRFFDAVYAVSTFEHMGISGRYGIKTNIKDIDFKVMTEISRILKPGGSLFITVPYGYGRILKSWARIYDWERLKLLLDNWKTDTKKYFIRDSDGNGLLVIGELESEADFEKNEATILMEVVRGD